MINSKSITHPHVSNRASIMNRQAGFTLIELVIVITILGVLSAVAVPRFIDLSEEAHKSAVSGTAGAFAVGLMLVRSEAVMKNILPHTSMLINGVNVVVNQDLKPYDVTAAEITTMSEQNGSSDGCFALWDILMGDGAPTIETESSTANTSDYIVSHAAATLSTGGCTYTYRKELNRTINWNKKASRLTIINA
ncbi:MAG: MSHA pilin protein MshB [Gammaproteobacteria bacterium]|jgi:MSHA pilin protein MshB